MCFLKRSMYLTFHYIKDSTFCRTHDVCFWTFAVSNLKVFLSINVPQLFYMSRWITTTSSALLASAPYTTTTTISDEHLFDSDQTINTWPVSLLLSIHAWSQFSIKINPSLCWLLFTFEQGKKCVGNEQRDFFWKWVLIIFCCSCCPMHLLTQAVIHML